MKRRICKDCGINESCSDKAFRCNSCVWKRTKELRMQRFDSTFDYEKFAHFISEMIYRKCMLFDMVDIFRMLDYWVIIMNKDRKYDNLETEQQLENYWRDLIIFYSNARKNGKIKGSVKNDIFK